VADNSLSARSRRERNAVILHGSHPGMRVIMHPPEEGLGRLKEEHEVAPHRRRFNFANNPFNDYSSKW